MVMSFPSSSFFGFIIIVASLTPDVEKAAITRGCFCSNNTGLVGHRPDILKVVDGALRMRRDERDIMGMKRFVGGVIFDISRASSTACSRFPTTKDTEVSFKYNLSTTCSR